jgi:hypothetical protein
MGAKMSESAAIANLRRMFGDSERVTLDKIFENADRRDNTHASNMTWLYNKMTSMRKYDLFTTRYTVRNGTRAIGGLVLTAKGKQALGEPDRPHNRTADQDSTLGSPSNQVISLQTIADIVDEFNRQNPSWELEVVPKRVKKEVEPMQQR